MIQDYLVGFTYDYYCQGYEKTTRTVLIRKCVSFQEACAIILGSGKFKNARNFENWTL